MVELITCALTEGQQGPTAATPRPGARPKSTGALHLVTIGKVSDSDT